LSLAVGKQIGARVVSPENALISEHFSENEPGEAHSRVGQEGAPR
jgi:hypothetical protein